MTQPNTEQSLSRPYFNETIRWRFLANALWIASILAILACLVLAGTTSSEQFWSSQNVQNLMRAWLIPALMVAPMALIIATGGLDLSVGAVAGLVATVIASLTSEGLGVGPALILGLLLALVIGLSNGLLIGVTKMHGAIITLGMLTLLNGLNLMLTGGQLIRIEEAGLLLSPALPVIGLILLTILTIGLVELTPFGRRDHSEAEQPEPWFQRLFFAGAPYVLSSLIAGFAGAWLLGRLRAAGPTIGAGLEVDVILMVLLGGTPLGVVLVNIIGALVAAFLVSVAQNISTLNGLPFQAILIGKGAAFLVFALLSYVYFHIVKWVVGRKKAVSTNTNLSNSETNESPRV
jgi:ribose transport system permease protein